MSSTYRVSQRIIQPAAGIVLSPVEIATLLKLGFAAGYPGSPYRKDI